MAQVVVTISKKKFFWYDNSSTVRECKQATWQWLSPLANTGLTPADFVSAWRRTVDIFREEGVTNVAWVWTPSAVPPNTRIWLEGVRKIENYYPGDDYVDWAGGDTYNAMNWLDYLYDFAVAHQKPFFLAEWGVGSPYSTMTPDQQNTWLEDMFNYFESHPKAKAVLYFNYNWGDVNKLTADLTAADHI